MFRGHRMGREKVTAKDSVQALRRLMRYFRPYAGLLALVGVLLVLNALFQVLWPYLRGVAVDQFIAPEGTGRPGWLNLILAPDASPIVGLTWVMLLWLGTLFLTWATTAAQFFLMTLVGQKVLLQMRTQILARIHSLSLKFFDENEAGDLMSRLVNDTDVVNQVFSGSITRLLSLSLTLVGYIFTMISFKWDLALVSFAVLPVMVLATTVFAKRARVAFRKTRETIGNVSSELQENISGVREVQAFSRERENVAEFRQINRQNRDANVQAQTLTSAFTPALDVLSTIALAIVLIYGGWLVLQGRTTVGMVVTFMTYVQRFYQPIRGLSNLWTQFQSALAGAERIFELLDKEPEVVDAPDAIDLPSVEGRVVFDKVHFAYKEDEPVLRGVSLAAEPGQTVALVGPTGAGKTSVISLLMRFYDVVDGRITVDGHDVRQVKQASLRRQMGIVLQDTFLFSGTVMENIRYGRLDATDDEVIAAAELANAHTFIERLADGYDTNIGERGQNLSQGQRQLISIARAVLANPRILILDEATSSVDTRTELLIQKALDQLLHGRTSFVIAHRLSTIRNADQVLVIEQGEIVERGTHTTLMAQQGRYYELYMSQFRRESEMRGDDVAAGEESEGRASQLATAPA